MIHTRPRLDPGASAFLPAIERHCATEARTRSAMRIFSGQERVLRLFCQRACLSSNRPMSLIEEPHFESSPRFSQAVPPGEACDFFPADTARFEQG